MAKQRLDTAVIRDIRSLARRYTESEVAVKIKEKYGIGLTPRQVNYYANHKENLMARREYYAQHKTEELRREIERYNRRQEAQAERRKRGRPPRKSPPAPHASLETAAPDTPAALALTGHTAIVPYELPKSPLPEPHYSPPQQPAITSPQSDITSPPVSVVPLEMKAPADVFIEVKAEQEPQAPVKPEIKEIVA